MQRGMHAHAQMGSPYEGHADNTRAEQKHVLGEADPSDGVDDLAGIV